MSEEYDSEKIGKYPSETMYGTKIAQIKKELSEFFPDGECGNIKIGEYCNKRKSYILIFENEEYLFYAIQVANGKIIGIDS